MAASSCFLHSPFLPPRPSSSSSSSFSNLILSSHYQPFVISLRNAGLRRRIRAPLMASINPQNPPDSLFPDRRVLIFLGAAIFPFLKWKNRAPSVMAAGGDIQKTQAATDEQGLQRARPTNPFLSLINAIGTLGSGIFGALYALARRDKIAMEKKIESLTNEVKEKDAAIVSMAKDFESKLVQQQEEGKTQLSAAKEERLSLINQLNSANGTISGIKRALQDEKAITEELQSHIDTLHARFLKIEDDKLSLKRKLKQENDSVSLLQENVKILSSEVKNKEEIIQNLNSLLVNKDADLENLGAELNSAKRDLARMQLENSSLVEDLVKVKTQLNQKSEMVNGLNSRLCILEAERDELRTDYNALLKDYEELKASSAKKATFDAVKLEGSERERSRLDESYRLAMVRTNEYEALVSSLARERDELKKNLDLELKGKTVISEHRDSLEKELIEVYQKAKTATRALQEGKTVISSLNAQLQSLEKQAAKDKEARGILETDLDEATKALDEMNKQTLSFSSELETASNEINNLRDEKERLRKELEERKKAAAEAAGNLDGAQKVIMRLGSERGSLEGKVRELEMELASSKSEMLKMKTKQEPKLGVEDADEATKATPVKKNFRRRRGSS